MYMPFQYIFEKTILPDGKTLLEHSIECCLKVSVVSETELMYLCAFYHDIGKADSSIVDKKTFKGHELKGTSFLHILKSDLKLSVEEFDCIVFVKENHENFKKLKSLKNQVVNTYISSPYFPYLYLVAAVNDTLKNNSEFSLEFEEIDRIIAVSTNPTRMEVMLQIINGKCFSDFALKENPELKNNNLLVAMKNDFKLSLPDIKFSEFYNKQSYTHTRRLLSKVEFNLPFGIYCINGDFIPLKELCDTSLNLIEQDYIRYDKYQFCGYSFNSCYSNWLISFEFTARAFIKKYTK